jgi:type I restriction enzyme S subunit
LRGYTESLKEIGYQGVRQGDLVIHVMDGFAGAIGVSDSDGRCTPAYAVCEPTENALTHYYAQVLREMARSHWLVALAKGIRERTSDFRYETFGGQLVPLPPLPEQSAIVRFLDHADRRIRRYIRAKQELIKLLEEQRQVIIHRAVTRGLDPNVRLKPSSVEWLGDVPEHWEVKRLKWVTRLQRGYDLPADRRVPGPFPVVSSGGLIDTHSESRCTGPGVVMGRYGSTDAVFYVEQDFWPHNTSLFVTHFQGNTPKWCYYLLRSIAKAEHAGKSAVPGVDRKDLFQIVVPVPPVDEQAEIVRSIEEGSRDLNDIISTAARGIVLLREYRTRLIADVVTGKVDVREAASHLPDEAEEQEPVEETEELTEEGYEDEAEGTELNVSIEGFEA